MLYTKVYDILLWAVYGYRCPRCLEIDSGKSHNTRQIQADKIMDGWMEADLCTHLIYKIHPFLQWPKMETNH